MGKFCGTADHSERVIEEMVRNGCNVVFTTSFGYMDATLSVAWRHPQVYFLHCSGYKTAPNVSTYFGRIEQPRYLSGLVAGKMTRSNIIGYVAAHPIPEVVRGINAFALGAMKINPEVKVRVVWTHTWYDPGTEKEAAESFLNLKADVIAQHQDTPAPQQAAEERGAYGIGYNCDLSAFAPRAHLTAPIWNWGPYYVRVVKSIQEGKWKSEKSWGGMKDGVVDLAPLNPTVPKDVKRIVEEKKKEILEGKFEVFTGPIRDNEGKVKIPEGSNASDEEQLKMDWFVEGVEGKVTK